MDARHFSSFAAGASAYQPLRKQVCPQGHEEKTFVNLCVLGHSLHSMVGERMFMNNLSSTCLRRFWFVAIVARPAQNVNRLFQFSGVYFSLGQASQPTFCTFANA